MQRAKPYPGRRALAGDDVLEPYQFSDKSPDGIYFGFVDRDQNWYILKLTSIDGRYAKGSDDYATNWTGREDLTYYYFYELSW